MNVQFGFCSVLGVAFSANDNHVLIYKKSGGKWTQEAVLSEVSTIIFAVVAVVVSVSVM